MPDEFGQQRSDSPQSPEPEAGRTPRSRTESGLAFLLSIAVLGVLIYFGIAQGMAALVMFPGVPLVLLWFLYWFFLRRLIRIRNIRKAEERRLLQEAAQRSSR